MEAPGIDSLLMQVEKMKQEAYAAGWRDAIAAVNKVVGSLDDPAAVDSGDRAAEFSPSGLLSPASSDSKLPKQGTTPWEVVQIVRKRPGLTGAQIVDAVKTSGHGAPEGSIRTSIFRMKDRRFIVSRHGKWFPA